VLTLRLLLLLLLLLLPFSAVGTLMAYNIAESTYRFAVLGPLVGAFSLSGVRRRLTLRCWSWG